MRIQLLLGAMLMVVGLACSKKADLPKTFSAVPLDADLVATIDAKSLVAYAKEALPKLVPTTMQDKIPIFETLVQQAMNLIGLDLNQLNKITFVGYIGSSDKMALIAEGIQLSGLKGQVSEKHGSIDLYAMKQSINYAELKGLGIVVAPSSEILKLILDTFDGKSKSIADSDRGKLLQKFKGVEADLDQFRAYVLTAKMPATPGLPDNMQAVGVFGHMDKGAATTVLSDEASAQKLKAQIEIGKSGLQLALLAGGGDLGLEDLPIDLDKDMKKIISNMLAKIQTTQSKDLLTISYHGDLKPIVEKAVAFGLKNFTGKSDTPNIEEAGSEEPEDVLEE